MHNINNTKESSLNTRVLYADTDRMDVAYYAIYLRWFEAGRAHFMRTRGYPYSEVEKNGVLFPVIEAHVNYFKSARYDDELDVITSIEDIKGAKLRFNYRIECKGIKLVDGYTVHAAINPEGRPIRIPRDVKTALEAPQGKS